MRYLVTVLLLLLSCGKAPSRPTTSPTQDLQSRYSEYKSLAVAGKWAYPHLCDGLLFSALEAVGQDREFPIEEARDASGAWFRNPDMDCYPNRAASDVSRDMFNGLFVYLVHFHRLDLAQDLWTYGQEHSWLMGRGDTSAVLTPGSIGRLARIIYYLGGADHAERRIPDVQSTNPGFEAHLSMLALYVDGITNKGLSSPEIGYLRTIATKEPGNPLAQALYHKYTDGNQTVATELLLSIYPNNRLPTQADWCEEWRPQRADGDSGLKPCNVDRPETHSGGDFLFVAALILGDI